MTIGYVSTRSLGSASDTRTFTEVLLAGMAPDGGLYVPTSVPRLPTRQSTSVGAVNGMEAVPRQSSPARLSRQSPPARLAQQSSAQPSAGGYAGLAARVMGPYMADAVSGDRLAEMTADAYSAFRHPDVCPLVALGEDHYLLELFHGPTFAFKDIALQVVARLFDHELECRRDRMTIVGATSGDTGSAAMQAVAGRDRINAVILHPEGRTSEIQRRQMTTLTAPNVHAVAVDGTFDDCQDLVKAMFADEAFRRGLRLAAVNSINWARVVAQVVYYVWSSRQIDDDRPVMFCVPTGNFGNVLAGHYARRMGLPMSRLLVASNANDILSRFLHSGELSVRNVVETLSPSMDIQVSSNLERLLFELLDGDGAATAALLEEFRSTGCAGLGPDRHDRLTAEFSGGRLDDQGTLAVMARVHAETGMVIDPHTAVGVGVARRCRMPGEVVVTLATAHPAKFPEAVIAATGAPPDMPEALAAVSELPERCTRLPNDLSAVQAFVRSVSRA